MSPDFHHYNILVNDGAIAFPNLTSGLENVILQAFVAGAKSDRKLVAYDADCKIIAEYTENSKDVLLRSEPKDKTTNT